MRILLSPWPWFAVAAAIAFDSGIAAEYGHYAAALIERAASVLP